MHVLPVQVRRVSDDVIGPTVCRVAGMPKAFDPCGWFHAPRPQSGKGARPDADSPDLGPAERAQEDRRRRLRSERQDDRHAALLGLGLMLALERLKDALASRVGSRRRVHGEACKPLVAREHHAEERVSGDPDDAAVCPRHRHQRTGRVVPEPPVELRAGERKLAPGCLQQTQVVLPLRRLVRRQIERHYFVDVPSAALNRRRACVPVTVSFTEIRSQAPASTSSNVRGE